MDKEKDENLDEELDEEITPEVDDEDADNGADDEFDYDEDGNIIIPDVVDEDEQEDEEVADDEQDENEEDEENEGSEEPEEVVEPANEPDEKDVRIAKLERELTAFKNQGKATLSKLGVEGDNVLEGLEKLAAEADDITLEEYKKKKALTERNEEALKMLQKAEFEKKMKADLAELQAAYPETKKYGSIDKIENFAEFGRFRDMGLSPKQAYAAANPDSVRQSVADAVKQKSLNSTKEHLKSAVPKGSKDDSLKMPKSTLSEWRDLFPDKSDKEIIALYKQSYSK